MSKRRFYYRLTLSRENRRKGRRARLLIETSAPIDESTDLIRGTEVEKDGSAREHSSYQTVEGVRTLVTRTFFFAGAREDVVSIEPLDFSNHYGALTLAGSSEPI